MNDQKHFSPKKMAEKHDLSESYLAKLRTYGGGPAYIKCGRRVLYDASVFEDWLESHSRSSTSEATA